MRDLGLLFSGGEIARAVALRTNWALRSACSCATLVDDFADFSILSLGSALASRAVEMSILLRRPAKIKIKIGLDG